MGDDPTPPSPPSASVPAPTSVALGSIPFPELYDFTYYLGQKKNLFELLFFQWRLGLGFLSFFVFCRNMKRSRKA